MFIPIPLAGRELTEDPPALEGPNEESKSENASGPRLLLFEVACAGCACEGVAFRKGVELKAGLEYPAVFG